MLFTRFIGLLLVAAEVPILPAIASGAQDPPKSAMAIQGKCRSSHRFKACDQCEVTLEQQDGIELPTRGGSLAGRCPKMAAGTYILDMALPIKLVPARTLDSKAFFQVKASFSVRAHNAGAGDETQLLLHTEPLSWSWWSKGGMTISNTNRIQLAQNAFVEIDVKMEDAQYFVPHQTEGAAYRDGRLSIGKGAVIRLVPSSASKSTAARDPGAP